MVGMGSHLPSHKNIGSFTLHVSCPSKSALQGIYAAKIRQPDCHPIAVSPKVSAKIYNSPA